MAAGGQTGLLAGPGLPGAFAACPGSLDCGGEGDDEQW